MGMKNYLKKFEFRPSTFQEKCHWYSEGIFLRNFRQRINIFRKSVLGIVDGQILSKKFYRRVYIFDHKCPWLSEGNFTIDPELF